MSNDPYVTLAAAITGRPEHDITAEERTKAKQAFFESLNIVAMLPGNENLRSTLVGELPTIRQGDVIRIVYGSQDHKVAVTHVEAHIITTADL